MICNKNNFYGIAGDTFYHKPHKKYMIVFARMVPWHSCKKVFINELWDI